MRDAARCIRAAIEHYREDVEHRAFPVRRRELSPAEAARQALAPIPRPKPDFDAPTQSSIATRSRTDELNAADGDSSHRSRTSRSGRARERNDGGNTIGLVPTMGALHAGHASLIRAARASCAHVAVSIFVNPTQFGPNEDFARYPRTFEADCALAEAEGADVLFAPAVEELYPDGRSDLCRRSKA